MLLRLAGRAVWFVSKFTVKHILVPIAITAATAVALQKLADRIAPPESPVKAGPDGQSYVDLDLQPKP